MSWQKEVAAAAGPHGLLFVPLLKYLLADSLQLCMCLFTLLDYKFFEDEPPRHSYLCISNT